MRFVSTLVLLAACGQAPPAANPDFSDAMVYVFRSFEASEAELAYGIRALEAQTYLSLPVEASRPQDRAITPGRLTDADVAGLETPGLPPEDALPVALARTSAFEVDAHAGLPLLVDQTPLEPYSPTFYERDFLEETESCWEDRGCEVLLTWNDLIKENALMTVPYTFYKDYRWVDLALPDPLDLEEAGGALPADHTPRWAFAARSWMTESAEGENGNTRILQSYSIEIWYPRDGRGFTLDGTEGLEWDTDSDATGSLRVLSVWTETEFDGLNVGDDLAAATTRNGIDDNMKAHESWLEDHATP